MSQWQAEAMALDFDLACMWFGRWVEGRERATKEVPRPKRDKKTIPVPKYTTRAQMLGIVEGMEERTAGTPRKESPVSEEQLEEFQRDPDALARWLRGEGETEVTHG